MEMHQRERSLEKAQMQVSCKLNRIGVHLQYEQIYIDFLVTITTLFITDFQVSQNTDQA